MNTREKLMAAGVGGLLLVFGVMYGWQIVGGWFTVKQNRLADLQEQLEEDEFQIDRGKRAVSRITELEQRSLPADVDVARSLYQQKLLEMASELELSGIEVSALPSGRGANGFQELSFKLKGRGDLRQATRLLHRFYRADTLQRIRYLSLKPVRESKQLDIDMTIQALVLDGAERTNKLSEGVDPHFAEVPVEKYLATIVGRNLFAKENRPPQLADTRKSTYPGESVSLELKGDDDDPLDTVRYALAEPAPQGASLDPQTGAFRWRAGEKGEHVFKVMAIDDGLPSKTTEAEIRVAVTDRPPPPKPREVEAPKPKEPNDDVLNTFVTGITSSGEKSLVWFNVRTTGESLKIPLDQEFEVGNFTGVVKHIGENSVEVLAEGRRYLFSRGDSFADAVEIPKEGL